MGLHYSTTKPVVLIGSIEGTTRTAVALTTPRSPEDEPTKVIMANSNSPNLYLRYEIPPFTQYEILKCLRDGRKSFVFAMH